MIKNAVFLLICSIFLIGCASNNTYTSSKKIVYENAKKYQIQKNVKYEPIITPEEYKKMLEEQRVDKRTDSVEDMNQALMSFYNEWKNVKYKYGGNSKKGIDCSAFTQRVFKEKFDLNIPRTTLTQVKIGKAIKRSELELGDLVFFKTGKFDKHVGVYMGNGDFMHASIKGVKFTKLDKPYYKRKYWTSRRVIQ